MATNAGLDPVEIYTFLVLARLRVGEESQRIRLRRCYFHPSLPQLRALASAAAAALAALHAASSPLPGTVCGWSLPCGWLCVSFGVVAPFQHLRDELPSFVSSVAWISCEPNQPSLASSPILSL